MADQDAIAMLDRGVETWNAWRRSSAGSRPLLMKANFGGGFPELNLAGADFSDTDLRRSSFLHVNLTGAIFRGANLYGASFLGCSLSRSDFSSPRDGTSGMTIASYCNFVSASLLEANFDGASLNAADFAESTLVYATFRRADLTRANFRNAIGTPLGDAAGISALVGNLSGAEISDLSEGELQALEDLCAVFLEPFDDPVERARKRSVALERANVRGLDASMLRQIFVLDAITPDDQWMVHELRPRLAERKGVAFVEANLTEANLSGARFASADLRRANLDRAILVGTDLQGADLSGASVYGISAWDVNLDGTKQRDLSIVPKSGSDVPSLAVDNVEVAQFLYLLLNNASIRHVIETVTSKVVLLLGRFTSERKAVLDDLKDALRARQYVPVLFDFDAPASQTLTETVSTLAHIARFVVADLTDAKSVLQELRGIVPDRPSMPVQPILLGAQMEPGMLDFFKRFPWFLEVVPYDSPQQLDGELAERVIAPAERMWMQLNPSA